MKTKKRIFPADTSWSRDVETKSYKRYISCINVISTSFDHDLPTDYKTLLWLPEIYKLVRYQLFSII